jgi:hypothetical protein
MGGTSAEAPTEPSTPYRRPGEAVAIREVWAGRVWEARPAIVVRDDPSLTMLHVPAHVHCQVPVDPDGQELRLPIQDWAHADVERGSTSVLSFAFPDTPYAVILGYDEDGRLLEYYVNLQTPLERSAVGYDLVEHVLDVTIPPDRSSWSWKDEDELEIAIDGGLFTEEDAAWFHFWGERAVEHVLLREPPFDEDWAEWHADPAWETPGLPPDWELVSA